MHVGAMSMSEKDQKISSWTIGNNMNLIIVKLVLVMQKGVHVHGMHLKRMICSNLGGGIFMLQQRGQHWGGTGTQGMQMTMDENDNNDGYVLHDSADTDAADIADTVSTG